WPNTLLGYFGLDSLVSKNVFQNTLRYLFLQRIIAFTRRRNGHDLVEDVFDKEKELGILNFFHTGGIALILIFFAIQDKRRPFLVVWNVVGVVSDGMAYAGEF
ncbi:hypothetical protein ACJX0J_030806, partial [Zea mays]